MSYPHAERLRSYREEVTFALEIGEGLTLRQVRDRLAALRLNCKEQTELNAIDAKVAEAVIELDEIAGYLLNDDDSQPMEKWWWHLGKIRSGAYPKALLPEHLKAVLDENQKTA